MSDPSKCGFCKLPLTTFNGEADRNDQEDCGGDCLRCMALIVEDPDCKSSLNRLRVRQAVVEAAQFWGAAQASEIAARVVTNLDAAFLADQQFCGRA